MAVAMESTGSFWKPLYNLLLQASFVPERPERELTRYRTSLVRERAAKFASEA